MAHGDVLTPRYGVLAQPAPIDPEQRRLRDRARVEGLVSVIMPAYNVAPYVADAVRSVLEQSYGRLELIVVDDGSTDETRTVLDELAGTDDRVRLHHRPNGGPNAARNHAIAQASGEFLTFLDGDDLLLPGAYERMVGSLQASGSDFVLASYLRLREEEQGPPAKWVRRAHATTVSAVTVADRPSLMVNAVQWSKLYRRSFWDDHVREFAVPGYYQDQLVSARAFGHARTVDALSEPSVAWRVRDDRTSMTQQVLSLDNMRDRFRTAREALDILGQVAAPTVHDARLTQFLNNDFGSTVRHVEDAPAEYWQALVEEVRALVDLVPRAGFWDRIYPQHKVVYYLIAEERRADVEEFNRAGGRGPKSFPVEQRGKGYYLHLPLWEDSSIPRSRFKLSGRYARPLREGRATWPGGLVRSD